MNTDEKIKSYGYKDLDDLLNSLVKEKNKVIYFENKINSIKRNIENVNANITSYELFFQNIANIMNVSIK